LLPWNWFRPSTQTRALEATYQKKLTGLKLSDLPDQPRFVFCATDMYFGVSWVFEKRRVGSYQAGYLAPSPAWPVAKAVAASSCFPPVFNPLPIEMEPSQKIVDGAGQPTKDWAGMSVSDGGLYDNLGLQPVEAYHTVLVSDGGQPFFPAYPKGVFGRLKAYLSIQGKQAGAIRKRHLISEFQHKNRFGTYWGIGGSVTRYRLSAAVGYSKQFATNTIADVRTDMDAFSDGEIAVLMNHGYLLADIAIQIHVPQLMARAEEIQVPFPELLIEGNARQALKESHVRKLLGRF
jgi:NTE family protein